MSIIGKRAKKIQIPAPVGVKIPGTITEVKLSERFDGLVDVLIELPDYTLKSDDGRTTFVKRVYYSVALDWSPKNKGGRLYKSLYGGLPAENEDIDWERVLLKKQVLVILEDNLDENTGDVKGQKVKWIGAKNPPPVQEDPEYGRLGPDEELPPGFNPRDPGQEG